MMNSDKLHIVSWSGGKDSTATIILAHELGLPIDLIIMSVVWFDKSRGIYGENPEHIKWVIEYAKPLFESWGYKVEIITSERDYIYWFNHIITKTKHPERVGKKAGWLLGGKCCLNREKVRPMQKYIRSLGDCEQYIGIAIDEKERLERLHEKKGQISLLEQQTLTKLDAYNLCARYNLLSPTYIEETRGGCWFCPNQSIVDFARLKKNHPELWDELSKLDEEPNKVSEGFKYGMTFKQVAVAVDDIVHSSQLSLFDFIKEDNDSLLSSKTL